MKEKIFFTAKNDKVFKNILGDEDNKEILIKFLKRILKIEIEDIKYLKNELTINYPEERRKTVDLLVKTKDLYIHIELNNGYKEYLHKRNFCYFTNLYSKKTKAGKAYNMKEKFIQINFTYKKIIESIYDKEKILKDKEPLRIYKVMDKENIKYIENFEIWEYNMDRIMQIWYDKEEEEIEKYKHLIMLDSNKEELEALSKGDDLVKEFKKEIETLNENETYTSWLTPEEDEEFILNTEKNMAYDQGLLEGEQKGKKEGLLTRSIEIARTLLNKGNMTLEEISEITDLSIEDLKNL